MEVREEKGRGSIWVYLLWIVIFIAACMVAFIAWKTMGNFETEVFPIGANIEGLGSQISRIEEHYSNLANEQKELLEVWGLAALILGVSGAVASVLRGPQAVIVAFGGFAAVIFGATKIYDPQLAMKALNSARSQLACVSPRVQILSDLSKNTRSKVPSALSSLVESLPPLLEGSASFMILVSRLNEIRDNQLEERESALKAIDQALLQPISDLSFERRRLGDRLMDIASVRYEIEKINNSDLREEIAQTLSKITTVDQQLTDAIDTLMRTEMMQDRLSSQSSMYREEMVRSASQLAISQKLSNEALALTQELPSKIDKLRIWPAEFESAVSVAYKTVNEIQNQVVSKISSGGVAESSIQKIVIAAADAVTQNASIDPSQMWPSPIAIPPVSSNFVSRSTPSLSAKEIIKKASMAINRAEQLLLEYKGKIEYANSKAQGLDELIINQLPVIVGSIKVLGVGREKLSERMPKLQSEVDAANQALKKANEILMRPAPSQLKVEVEACT